MEYFTSIYKKAHPDKVVMSLANKAFDKALFPTKNYSYQYFFFCLHENVCCGCLLKVPHQCTSDEHSQQLLLRRNERNSYADTLIYLGYDWQKRRPESSCIFVQSDQGLDVR